MKRFLIIVFVSFTQCSPTSTNPEIEGDVFLLETHNNFDIDGRIDSNINKQDQIYFSKDFWDFFMKKFPYSSAAIFLSRQENPDFYKLGDTSLTFYDIDMTAPMIFKRWLPENPKSSEKELYHGGFYVIPKDTTGQSERLNRVKEKLSSYNLSDNVRSEYSKLFKILTNENSNHHYIVIFKKHFGDKIYDLYK